MKPYRPAGKGEANHQAKLNRHEAREVREARRAAPAELARAYEISVSQVYRLRKGERWLDLE